MLSTRLYEDFPTLKTKINGRRLVYLDNAATTLKPKRVVEKLKEFYYTSYSNVHRAVHTLASRATVELEESRERFAEFLGVSPQEIIFTSGTTMAINLVAVSLLRSGLLKENDLVLTSLLEHHANFVPWLRLSRFHGYRLEYIKPSGRFGTLEMDDLMSHREKNPKVLAITGLSNVTGQRIPVEELRNIFPNAIIVLDGAQLLPHERVKPKEIGVDFLAFSLHKMLGPTGVGVLYGRKELLEQMEPFLYGGEMIDRVSLEDVTFNELPYKFEAGTPNIADIVASKEALAYLEEIGFEVVHERVERLTQLALEELSRVDGVELYGPLDERQHGIVSFNIKGVHPHDVAHILDQEFGVAIRSGHHCAQPLMNLLKEQSLLDFPNSTCRASFYLYNTEEDVRIFVEGVKKVKEWFSR
ncbi:SufS family cysteine desulfurase [Thermotoga neapolitana]|uniref:SufS family cysteine desulfurase n=1 Tax=Thermotoga neapolitana TaxID=2337 RepID=UPI0002FD126A|nr:SufS family cysteine desulfurase [Thermotoga neapolitana]KFZ21528.1 cysteine desulfurase [Thermotoga neapolitana LA10]MDK2785884.1 cysteine desulfurase / selenocysteine lyase [Thermotoga sp.]MDK2950004.1 cysteine desulfurase / selenocysteine lyase [Thermotoga sp.]HBF11249.1 SufS family cysteine desulfurase [Thermotoga neapolitana]